MPEKSTEYRVMINAPQSLEDILEKQLISIAKNVYDRGTNNVIYRVKTENIQTNPRKLFFPGKGEVLEGDIGLHMAVSQKIVISEDEEEKLFKEMSEVVKKINPFALISTGLGGYGENFTIYLAFAKSKDAEKLTSLIEQNMKPFFADKREKRDILHFTLLYDDASKSNIKRAWEFIDESILVNKKFQVNSIWLWKNKQGWMPYKEFQLGDN